jgi:hypothetical protein
MFFLEGILFLVIPVGMVWQIAWIVRHGRLPTYMGLTGVTREDMQVTFWLHVAGQCCATAVVLAVYVAVLSAALRAAGRV